MGDGDIDAVSGASYTSARLQEVPPVGPGPGRWLIPPKLPVAVRHAEEVMGTVFSFDVRGGDPSAVGSALAAAIAGLHKVNEVFSTYQANSQISRLARGEISVADCDPEVAEVLDLCAEAERVSEGWFSHTYQGQIDPTGLVKGWAAERAARTLTRGRGELGVSVNGGGDVQLCGAPGPGRPWRARVGPAAPRRPGGRGLGGGHRPTGGGHLGGHHQLLAPRGGDHHREAARPQRVRHPDPPRAPRARRADSWTSPPPLTLTPATPAARSLAPRARWPSP